ncbi:hypothetical protein [Sphingomonas colocasiae]|uniref:Uncharacterized protein n=1 Tax=Sphingomonas colocasiae TaxID=1848973 RepID=A0ABS7PUK4_9SPHN|nr:hypothetical protein [Sphingomonas colocasiae]MBY8825040.1 hypothetical protein [Sphingomonas colocasiae]
MAEHVSRSVGLGGDGDEIEAIEAVERAFGVTLDMADAPGWQTAGDVFASLLNALPIEARRPDLWTRFAVILCDRTGARPGEIDPASPLLARAMFNRGRTGGPFL